MQLIIKPTGICNFNCTFCSAGGLDIAHPTSGVPQQIKDLIEKLKPNSLIITGGEPLTVDPSYYLELYDIAKCHIGFTSNMKDFYYHPDKWEPIIKNPNFGFITSFNYGDTRRWDPDTPYTEEKFIEVFNLFEKVSGGMKLGFIAVIDEDNEDRILDHVYLAKSLGTKVKINPACKMGLQGKSYPMYKMVKAYIDIIDMGLGEYEMNCCDRRIGRCPFNINQLCQSTIRVCYVDCSGNLHYGCCEDLISVGHEIPMDTELPLVAKKVPIPLDDLISDKCMMCEMFRFCNACTAHRNYAKDFPNYCEEMMKLKDDLIRQGWAL